MWIRLTSSAPLYVLILLLASPAVADTLFSDETTFLNSVGVPLEFESFELPTATNTATLSAINLTNLTVAALAPTFLGIFDSGANGLVPTDGAQILVWSLGSGGGEITFTFDTAILAFGVTLVDAGDATGLATTLSLDTNGGASFPSFFSQQAPNGNQFFVGIIADQLFTELTINSDTGEGIGFDSLYHAVPEPASGLLLGFGLLGLVVKRTGQRRERAGRGGMK